MHLIANAISATPTPTPSPIVDFDETQVTPGVIGFVVTGLFVVVVVLLVLDMVRRIRRTRYRAESQQRIAEELAARDADESAGGAAAATNASASESNASDEDLPGDGAPDSRA